MFTIKDAAKQTDLSIAAISNLYDRESGADAGLPCQPSHAEFRDNRTKMISSIRSALDLMLRSADYACAAANCDSSRELEPDTLSSFAGSGGGERSACQIVVRHDGP